VYKATIQTPIGFIQLCADDQALTSATFVEHYPDQTNNPNLLLEEAEAQLLAYLSGKLNVFDIPIAPRGSSFQNSVWNELLKIKYGDTRSYLEMAIALGDKKCIRAAAAANGKNPISIIIPCHRVIGSNGQLIGYAGGLWRKKWLLLHERSLSNSPSQYSLFP